jgi:hypothetical protein
LVEDKLHSIDETLAVGLRRDVVGGMGCQI